MTKRELYLDALREEVSRKMLLHQHRPLSLRDLVGEEDEGRKALLEIDDILMGKV